MTATLKLFKTQESFTDFEKCVTLRFEKERYTPYSTLSCIFVNDGNFSGYAYKARLSIDGASIHYGPVDSFECYLENGISYVKLTSRGFSMGLSQNQPRPQMNLNVNLQSLIDSNITIPHVACQQDTVTANYIYVKENSSLWDAIVALGQKTYGEYPFIYSENTIRLTKPSDSSVNYSAKSIAKQGSGLRLLSLVSHYHMKDTEDEYSFSYENPSASAYEIVRHKYMNLDRQWLADPDSGLAHKGHFSEKGIRYSFVRLCGFCPTDLRNDVVIPDGSTKEVSRIRYDYSQKGFFTTLWFYDDAYSV